MEQPREARATQPEEVGVVGGPEEVGLEHFLDAFYFPLKLTFIAGTMTSLHSSISKMEQIGAPAIPVFS